MNRGLYVDTGCWVALFDLADPYHARAQALFDSNREWVRFLNEHVLSETVTLLRSRVGPESARNFGRDVLEGKVGHLLKCDRSHILSALELIVKYHDQRISFADATSVLVVRAYDIPKVASFDRHFRIILTEREIVP